MAQFLSKKHFKARDGMIPPSKVVVFTEDGLTAGTGQNIKVLLRNWQNIQPTSQNLLDLFFNLLNASKRLVINQ